MMMPLRLLLGSILVLSLCGPSFPDEAKTAFKRGASAEAQKQYDAAFESYKKAHALKPQEARYATAYLRMRGFAATQHVSNGLKLRESQKLPEAIAEFQRAAEIDGTNFAAVQELRNTAALLKKLSEPDATPTVKKQTALSKLAEGAEGPVDLEPSPNSPVTLRMTATADNVYRTIGKLGGINVLFDLDYKPQKITIELNEVMVREALRMVAMESKTFWRPISPTAIFVASESKRKEFESNVMKTFYLTNASTPNELQEVVGTLKGILDINRIQVNPTRGSITLRGTPDQMVLAQKIIQDSDKAKAEVVIDIAVMQVSRDRLNNWGTTVPTSTSVTPLAAGGAVGGAAVKIGSLNGSNFVVPIPSASFTLLASDSNTKILQKPQLRALDNEKATLKIGDRVPVATGSFTPGIGGGSISPLVNTQFQYLDVGVNIDITPHIHSDREVTLKMVLEISSVTGQQNIGGISQPVIGQRRIEHETRLEDGDVNLVGGILEDSETRSLSGYPWLTKIPILKYLFGQENKDHRESEIVFAITPHIVRAEEITDENERMIDIGTGNSIGLRYKEAKPTKTPVPGQANPQGQKRSPANPPGKGTEPPRPPLPSGG